MIKYLLLLVILLVSILILIIICFSVYNLYTKQMNRNKKGNYIIIILMCVYVLYSNYMLIKYVI
jgi:hypothetical protein